MRQTMELRNSRKDRWGLLAALSVLATSAFADGSLDPSFGTGGKVRTHFGFDDHAGAVALQADGKLVVAGTAYTDFNTVARFGLARYLPDGSLDTTFDGDGRVITPFAGVTYPTGHALARRVAVQDDGKILAVGELADDAGAYIALARYLADGSLDVTFGGDGKVVVDAGVWPEDMVLQPDGKIVVTGWFAVIRLLPDGTLDTTFGTNGVAATGLTYNNAVVLQADGKIVTAGATYDAATSQYRFSLARFESNGAVDATFGVNGRVITHLGGTSWARTLALQPDGKIVAAGSGFNVAVNRSELAVARYGQDGTLDPTFSSDGMLFTNFGATSGATSVLLQPDGKIVAAGTTLSQFALARYHPDGALDVTFDVDGLVTTAFITPGASSLTDLARQLDGKLVAVGFTGSTGPGTLDFALARYE
jgi:uncharacterized delta-60 repeat protein